MRKKRSLSKEISTEYEQLIHKSKNRNNALDMKKANNLRVHDNGTQTIVHEIRWQHEPQAAATSQWTHSHLQAERTRGRDEALRSTYIAAQLSTRNRNQLEQILVH